MSRTALFLMIATALSLAALVVGASHPNRPALPPPFPNPAPSFSDSGSIRLEGRSSHPLVPPGRSDLFLTADLRGADVPGARRRPVNFACVIDRSGSMAGEKLDHAKGAARALVQKLTEADRLTIVHYGSDVRSLPGLSATPANQERMLAFIDQIRDEGGTNIDAALREAARELMENAGRFEVNRIILITDGQPTEGVTAPDQLISTVREIHRQGVTVSAIGVGADFNESLIQAFAESGAGSYGYLSDASQLATIFAKDLDRAATTVATDVELSLDLPAGASIADVLGYRWTQEGRTIRIQLPDFSANQVERVVAQLSIDSPSEEGAHLDVGGWQLWYRDLRNQEMGRKPHARVALSATVTRRLDEVTRRQDPVAALAVARAQSAKNMEKAAEAAQHGNLDAARQLLDFNIRSVFGASAAALAGATAPAVQADIAAQHKAMESFAQASSPEQMSDVVKATKAKALTNFGRMDTY